MKEKKHVDTNRTEDLFINKSDRVREREKETAYQISDNAKNNQLSGMEDIQLNREEKKDECRDVALDPPLKDLSNNQK